MFVALVSKRICQDAFLNQGNLFVDKLTGKEMTTLLQQLKKRRRELALKQSDMMLRVGVSRQQYQRLESRGNPRLNTLELVAKGLNSTLVLVPKEKWGAVCAVLETPSGDKPTKGSSRARDLSVSSGDNIVSSQTDRRTSLSDDPWQDLLGDKE